MKNNFAQQCFKMAKKGYIYVISSDFGSKIGKATDFESRFSSIQTSSPVKLNLKRVYSVLNFDAVEKKLHSLFKDKHIRGEWFDIDDDDLEHINDYLEYNNYLVMEVDLKTKKINYTTKQYLHKPVSEISSTNEIALQTEINNLKNEIHRLNDENIRISLNSYKTRDFEMRTIISLLRKKVVSNTKKILRRNLKKISK